MLTWTLEVMCESMQNRFFWRFINSLQDDDRMFPFSRDRPPRGPLLLPHGVVHSDDEPSRSLRILLATLQGVYSKQNGSQEVYICVCTCIQ